MSSLPHGDSTLAVEITNISAHGIWILTRRRELFMAYDDFPWFKRQPVAAILNVVEESPGHFHWPDIDANLTEEIIEHPERFPLIARG